MGSLEPILDAVQHSAIKAQVYPYWNIANCAAKIHASYGTSQNP